MKYECHAHMALDGIDYKTAKERHLNAPCDSFIREALAAYNNIGTVYIRDGGDRFGVSLRASVIAKEFGIEYVSPAFAISKKGHYGAFLGRSWEDLEEYKSLVAEVKNLGGSFIKLMISGILDFSQKEKITEPPLSADEIYNLTAIAHDAGFPVMVHANGAECLKNAVKAGVDSIEHGYYLDDECIEMLADSKTILVPTVCTVIDIQGGGRYDDTVLNEIGAIHLREVKKAHEQGVIIAPGSDAGSFAVLHAQGCIDEYKYLGNFISEAELNKNASILAQRFRSV